MTGAPSPLAAYDLEHSRRGARRLAGVDEAGRGCWAGPVVAAAVVLPDGWCPRRLNDSKKLNGRVREELCREIVASASSWGACAVSAGRIDRINILQATLEAMARSVAKLAPAPHLVLVDGRQIPPLDLPARAVVGGDATSAAIAAASILAKVFRDRIMVAWDRRFPGYGFSSHKGYGAVAHRLALDELGPCALHRTSYRPVADRLRSRLF